MLLKKVEKTLKGEVLKTEFLECHAEKWDGEARYVLKYDSDGTEHTYLPASSLNKDIVSIDRIYRWELASSKDVCDSITL